jgi:TRAP-type C4-dicarboxylate transport system substrate-binding protein
MAFNLLRVARILIPSAIFLGTLPAQTTIIRLGTLVPTGSRWLAILQSMADEWKKESGGTIELKIYPGGEQGDEPEMVQKMRIKKLQAVAISGAGLADLDPSVYALQIPMLLDSYEELDYVRDHISPRLEKELAQRGFIVLNWADVGWVHFFTKQPAMRPDDIRKLKLCVLQGDGTTFQLYKINGFHPVALAATDILTGLQTGLVDAIQSPPLLALSNQWFGGAKNMLDVPFLPLVGATLISNRLRKK